MDKYLDWFFVYCSQCGSKGPTSKFGNVSEQMWNDREPENQDPRDMGWVGQDGLP